MIVLSMRNQNLALSARTENVLLLIFVAIWYNWLFLAYSRGLVTPGLENFKTPLNSTLSNRRTTTFSSDLSASRLLTSRPRIDTDMEVVRLRNELKETKIQVFYTHVFLFKKYSSLLYGNLLIINVYARICVLSFAYRSNRTCFS